MVKRRILVQIITVALTLFSSQAALCADGKSEQLVVGKTRTLSDKSTNVIEIQDKEPTLDSNEVLRSKLDRHVRSLSWTKELDEKVRANGINLSAKSNSMSKSMQVPQAALEESFSAQITDRPSIENYENGPQFFRLDELPVDIGSIDAIKVKKCQAPFFASVGSITDNQLEAFIKPADQFDNEELHVEPTDVRLDSNFCPTVVGYQRGLFTDDPISYLYRGFRYTRNNSGQSLVTRISPARMSCLGGDCFNNPPPASLPFFSFPSFNTPDASGTEYFSFATFPAAIGSDFTIVGTESYRIGITDLRLQQQGFGYRQGTSQAFGLHGDLSPNSNPPGTNPGTGSISCIYFGGTNAYANVPGLGALLLGFGTIAGEPGADAGFEPFSVRCSAGNRRATRSVYGTFAPAQTTFQNLPNSRQEFAAITDNGSYVLSNILAAGADSTIAGCIQTGVNSTSCAQLTPLMSGQRTQGEAVTMVGTSGYVAGQGRLSGYPDSGVTEAAIWRPDGSLYQRLGRVLPGQQDCASSSCSSTEARDISATLKVVGDAFLPSNQSSLNACDVEEYGSRPGELYSRFEYRGDRPRTAFIHVPGQGLQSLKSYLATRYNALGLSGRTAITELERWDLCGASAIEEKSGYLTVVGTGVRNDGNGVVVERRKTQGFVALLPPLPPVKATPAPTPIPGRPSVVEILKGSTRIGEGHLIGASWVYAAASLIDGNAPGDLKIRYGRGSSTTIVGIASYMMHPNYSAFTGANNIGLLNLSSSVPMDAEVAPLPYSEWPVEHQKWIACMSGLGPC